jgi:tetratricopeptide (TPR) repeat protein
MPKFIPSIKRLSTEQKQVTPQVTDKERLQIGLALAKEKQLDEALVEFEAVLQNNPSSLPAHMGVGTIYYRQKRYDEAMSYFQRALQLDPLMSKAALKVGRIYLIRNELDKALEEFQNVLNLDPKSTQAYAGIGQIFMKQKQYDAALQQFAKALRLNPQMVKARLLVAQIYKAQGKFPEAIASLKTALSINPELFLPYVLLGRLHLIQQEYVAAKEAFQTIIDKDMPRPAGNLAKFLGLAEALIGVNELEEAANILRNLPEADAVTAKKHKLFGDIYYAQGLFKQATEEYQAAQLLASQEENALDEFDNIDILLEQDDAQWEELAGSYKSSGKALISDSSNPQPSQRRISGL